jgi:hypothetical protein
MDSLDLLYNKTVMQSKNKGIVNFKGDYDKWKRKKRTMRRADRMTLKNAGKSFLPPLSD